MKRAKTLRVRWKIVLKELPKDGTYNYAYLVTGPRHLDPSGQQRRWRRFFNNKAEAIAYQDVRAIAAENSGTAAAGLDAATLHAVKTALDQMQTLEIEKPIGEVLMLGLQMLQQRKSSRPIGEIFDQFLAEKISDAASGAVTKNTVTHIRRFCVRFVQSIGPARFASDITAEEIGAYLRKVRGSAKTRWHHHVTTRMLFGYAERHGYVEKSPMRHVPPPKVSNPLPQVFTPEETARFLLAVAETAPKQLAYYILSFFCGIRQSELLRLTWAAVDLHDGYLYLPAKITKTCAGRLVKLSPCTLEWLKLCSEREGRIYPGDKKTLGKKKKALMQKAGMMRWIRNGARHSFVSYHYALSENAYETASQAGHDVAMLIRHYRAIVPRAEAVKYWAIFPPSLDRRIVPLTPNSSAEQAGSLALGRTYP